MHTEENIKQPAGFYVLFLTEIWERFGFYLVNSLLILFMTQAMGYSDKLAYSVFAAFTALLYVVPAMGGYVADHYLGYRRTLMLGAVLLTAGYTLLGLSSKNVLFPALALIVVGTGFFKAMPYALLNKLYHTETQRKRMDGAFTLYYLSIQLGGLAPLFLGGFSARYFGWHPTFAIAAVGMAVGCLTFFLGRHCFKDADIKQGYCPVNAKTAWMLATSTALVFAIITLLLFHTTLTNIVVWTAAASIVAYVLFQARTLNKTARLRLVLALGLTGLGAIFFALYYQQPMSLTLFIERNVNRHFLGLNMPASSYWVFNPIWILIMGPCLNWLYNRLGKNNKDFSIMTKFGVGLTLMGLGYLTVVLATHFANKQHVISSWWIVTSYAFQSTAELLVNALGTAMIAKLVDKSILSVMMGVWFIGTSVGGILAGSFAKLAVIPAHMSAVNSLHVYSHAFSLFAWVSIAFGMITCFVAPFVKHLLVD